MKSTRYVQVWMQHAIVQTLVICIDLFVSGFAIFDLFAAVYDLNCVCVLTFHLQFLYYAQSEISWSQHHISEIETNSIL